MLFQIYLKVQCEDWKKISVAKTYSRLSELKLTIAKINTNYKRSSSFHGAFNSDNDAVLLFLFFRKALKIQQ